MQLIDRGRITLTSIRGNVKVRTADGTAREGLASPEHIERFDVLVRPGRYELQFLSDEHHMARTLEIDVLRAGHVSVVKVPDGIVQVDIVGPDNRQIE